MPPTLEDVLEKQQKMDDDMQRLSSQVNDLLEQMKQGSSGDVATEQTTGSPPATDVTEDVVTDVVTQEVVRSLETNCGVWGRGSTLAGLGRWNTTWKAENELYPMPISELGFKITNSKFKLN